MKRRTKPYHVILIGKQGSGKTTIAKALEERGFKRVVSATTRPPRDGEVDGQDYIFLTDAQWSNSEQFYVAKRSYTTVYGVWHYGILLDDINADCDTVTILDPTGYLEIRDKIQNCFAVFLDVDMDERFQRLLKRGDSVDEINRRERDDAEQFELLNLQFRNVCQYRSQEYETVGEKVIWRTPEEDARRIMRFVDMYDLDEINYDGRPKDAGIDNDPEF